MRMLANFAFLFLYCPIAIASDFAITFDKPMADARSWLVSQGFGLKIDADNPSKSRLSITERGLMIETTARAEPLITKENLSVRQPARLTVNWGVSRYPSGANWDIGVNNEAIMVIVQFGNEKISGGIFLPPSPFFIGFFLCEKGRQNVPIAGRSYKAQGRYVCIGSPPAGREVTSMIDLDSQFRAAFGTRPTPPVTGIAVEADTTQVNSDGRSSAWIRAIEIRSQ